jgi:hypothetical protein
MWYTCENLKFKKEPGKQVEHIWRRFGVFNYCTYCNLPHINFIYLTPCFILSYSAASAIRMEWDIDGLGLTRRVVHLERYSMINKMRSIHKPANDRRSIHKPANDMPSIDIPSDRPSTCRVIDEQPFSAFERHQLDIPTAWSPCHLPRQQHISRLTHIERLWAIQHALEDFQLDSIADALRL